MIIIVIFFQENGTVLLKITRLATIENSQIKNDALK